MKYIGLMLALLFIISTAVSAELYEPAQVLSQGKWAVLGAGALLKDSTDTNKNEYDYGVKVGVGIIPNLELQVKATTNSISGATAIGLTGSGTGSNIGAALKYCFIKEGTSLPVSVAGLIGYQSIKTSMGLVFPAGTNYNVNVADIGVGVEASKMLAINQCLYGGLGYHSYSQDKTMTALELDLGYLFAFSENWAVLGELNSSSLNDTTGATVSSNKTAYGLAVAYSF